jgi:hypothetical protein
MKIVIALVVLCGSVGIASAQERQPAALRAPVFSPKLTPDAAPAPPWYRTPAVQSARERHAPKRSGHDFGSRESEREIVCGLTVMKKSSDVDRGILARRKYHGESAIRRITPPVCTPHR